MAYRLTPIALAVSSIVVWTTPAMAAGGAAGAHGASVNGWGSPLTTIGEVSQGQAGQEGSAEGKNGADIAGKVLAFDTQPGLIISGTPGMPGQDAQNEAAPEAGRDPETHSGGAGAGGHGGGSVIGGISQGGAGAGQVAFDSEPSPISTNGGHGGAVKGYVIRLGQATLNGAQAGDGGNVKEAVEEDPNDYKIGAGGAGHGGHGGGSVIGGISSGGAGGISVSETSTVEANGGHAGEVSGHSITLTAVTLNGSTGGTGGTGATTGGTSRDETIRAGASGHAGHGGGSVMGGISTGGAAGVADATPYDFDSLLPVHVQGGHGARVSHNTITVTQASLHGEKGGDARNINPQGIVRASGNAGHGGGSIYGGISSAGAGGILYSEYKLPSGGWADGGHGGQVSDNAIHVTDSTLHGGEGGQAGVNSLTIGGDAGDGGGSVFGGLSTGAGGGYMNAELYESVQSATGGNGGSVSGNTVTLTHSTLIGAKGGDSDSERDSGSDATDCCGNPGPLPSGSAGHGGGSVFGGISRAGAGGSVQGGQAKGGDGGRVSGNQIELIDSNLNGAAGGNSHGAAVENPMASGSAGHGGGSVFGGLSSGAVGGYSNASVRLKWRLTSASPGETSSVSAQGGNGGEVSEQTIALIRTHLTGAQGGNSGQAYAPKDEDQNTPSTRGAGAGGHGGGSVFGGISSGAAGGEALEGSSAEGGYGNKVSNNTISLLESTLSGGKGGNGSNNRETPQEREDYSASSGAGHGGHGGGSVFGGISNGAAGGYSLNDSDAWQSEPSYSVNGGGGGQIDGHRIAINASTLTGAEGGRGGNSRGAYVDASGSGHGGHGGGSVLGSLSSGAAGGNTFLEVNNCCNPAPISVTANGGHGGNATGHTITVNQSSLTGARGGDGGNSQAIYLEASGSGHGGHGGGSVFGGISNGGAGGYNGQTYEFYNSYYVNGYTQEIPYTTSSSSANGGNGGDITGHSIALNHTTLTGADGGNGGSNAIIKEYPDDKSIGRTSGHGHGGMGGGSVFGGISSGAAGGSSSQNSTHYNSFNHENTDTTGFTITPYSIPSQTTTSVASSNGGRGGNVSGHSITLNHATLIGATGGQGGGMATDIPSSGSGHGGHGGGSVFGGLSSGAAGGHALLELGKFDTLERGHASLPPPLSSASPSLSLTANGGHGGNASDNAIHITDSSLQGAKGGNGGQSTGQRGHAGQEGGSVYGGFSQGGSGGLVAVMADYAEPPETLNKFRPTLSLSASGGNGGDTTGNTITLAGKSSLSGNIYGGFSQGGAAGKITESATLNLHDSDSTKVTNTSSQGQTGMGGRAENNTITLVGDQLSIAGAIYGGYSVNGDGTLNHDKAFKGNTLVLQDFRGAVAGLYNFENYHWVLPKDEFNGDTLITITGDDKVQLDNTKHTVAMENDGNRLHVGDKVTMISQAEGRPVLTNRKIRQGHFITYDATFGVEKDALVLRIAKKEEDTPEPPLEPVPTSGEAGYITPTSKAFLEGRLASLAQINQGADAISGIGLDAARNSVGRCGANLFMFIDGGSNRYETGSHIKLRNTNFGFGAANCFELQSKSQILVGAVIEHGNGNYDSYNQFDNHDDVHGWGKVRYTGAGVLMHMNVAGTGQKEEAPAPIARNNGLYLDAAIRAGKAKTRFDSNLVDPEGLKGQYNAKSTYYSVMAGAGYALSLDEKQAVDVYSRYTWSHLDSDTVKVGKDTLHLGKMDSSRLRLGARYSYAATPQVTPYVGLAYEREFSGKAKGSAYGMGIDSPTLKGNTGIAELGLTVVPQAAKQALSVNFGVQGFFSNRKGGAANLRVRYAF